MRKFVLFILSFTIIFSCYSSRIIYASNEDYTLKSGELWFPEDSTVLKGDITKIIFSNEYIETGNEIYVFNCDIKNEGHIKGFINGTELTIATVPCGNTIYANEDSDGLFKSFYSLSTIENFSMLNLSNVYSLSSWFWETGCNSNSINIDMSNLDFSNTHDFPSISSGIGQSIDNGFICKNINFTLKDQIFNLYADSNFRPICEGMPYTEDNDLEINYNLSNDTFILKDNSYGFSALFSYGLLNCPSYRKKITVDCSDWNVVNNNTDNIAIFDNALLSFPSFFDETIIDFSNMTISGTCNTSFEYFAGSMEIFSSNLHIDLSNLNSENLVSVAHMFDYVRIQENNSNIFIDLTNWNTPNLIDMSYMFNEFGSSMNYGTNDNINVVIDMTNFDTSNVSNMENAFNFSNQIKYDNLTLKLPKKSGSVNNTSNRIYGKDESVFYEFPEEMNINLAYTNKITYHLGNGKFNNNDEEITYGDNGEIFYLNNDIISKDPNYKFVGWYLDEDFSGSSITSLELLEDIELWAKYEKIKEDIEHKDKSNNYIYKIPNTGILY